MKSAALCVVMSHGDVECGVGCKCEQDLINNNQETQGVPKHNKAKRHRGETYINMNTGGAKHRANY